MIRTSGNLIERLQSDDRETVANAAPAAADVIERLRDDNDRLGATLRHIADEQDSGRHDGHPESGPRCDEHEAWLIAKEAIGKNFGEHAPGRAWHPIRDIKDVPMPALVRASDADDNVIAHVKSVGPDGVFQHASGRDDLAREIADLAFTHWMPVPPGPETGE